MDQESYAEQKDRLKIEQDGMTKAEVATELEKFSEYVQDLDNMPKTDHMWIKRGLKMSCEGAQHSHHSHFLVTR